MKAAVYYENGAPNVFRYEDVPDPECQANGVVIRVEAVSIEGGDTPAGSCADVKQPAPLFQSFSNYINPSSYLMQSRLNRGSNFGVLRIDDANDFKRRLQVEILGSAIRSFSWEPA